MATPKKPITIGDATVSDSQFFLEIKTALRRKKPDATNGDVIRELISSYNKKGNDSGQEVSAILEELKSLEERFIQAEKIITNKNEVNESLQLANAQLNEKVNELQNMMQSTKESFIISPPVDAMSKINRVIAAMVQENKLQRNSANIKADFAQKAIIYFIKNEYNHVLKS